MRNFALVHTHTQHSPSFTCNHSPKGVACPTYRFYFPINTKRDRMSLSNGQQSCFFIGRFRGQMWTRRPVILAESSCDIPQPSQAKKTGWLVLPQILLQPLPFTHSLTHSLSLTHTHTHTHTYTHTRAEINTRKYYVYVGCVNYVDLGSHHYLCLRTKQMRDEFVQFIVYTGGSVH